MRISNVSIQNLGDYLSLGECMNTVEKIVEICKDRKIAISRLEKACGFSNGYIRGLKRGDMPSNKLAKVADFLGVSTEYLSGEEEPVYYLNP